LGISIPTIQVGMPPCRWGCKYESSAGKILSHVIDSHNLIILNDRSFPTFLHPTSKHSIIDLTLVSEEIAPLCNSYIGFDALGSDHLPIFTTIGGKFCFRNIFLYKLKMNSKDLASLYQYLSNNIDNLKSSLSEDPLVTYTQTEQHIKNHLYSFFPPKSRLPRSRVLRKRPPPPPRWNENCQKAVDERKKFTRNFLIHPSSDNFIAYKRARSSCSKILKKQKRIGWRTYCSQFNHKTPTPEIWSLIKAFKKRKLTKSFIYIDSISQSQLTHNIISKLCPPSCLHLVWHSIQLMVEKDCILSNVKHDLEKPFSETEMQVAIKNAKFNSVPGIDQIDFNVISSLMNIKVSF